MYDGFILAGKIATKAGRPKQPVISADAINKLSEKKRWDVLCLSHPNRTQIVMCVLYEVPE
jgi:hypothetical protein